MKTQFGILVVAFAAVLQLAALVHAEPEPNATPSAWELTLEPTPLMRIVVDSGRGPKAYWYMLYTVTNNTGEDVDFNPEITRVSEIDTEGTGSTAGQNPAEAPRYIVDPAIIGLDGRLFDAIRKRHAKTHPFLVSPIKAIDRLLQGKDNARTSVAVFPELDPRVNKFTIYFGGLSGERLTRPNPGYNPDKPSGKDDGNPRVFVLQKTLAMPYTMPGDVNTRRSATPTLGRMKWVMR